MKLLSITVVLLLVVALFVQGGNGFAFRSKNGVRGNRRNSRANQSPAASNTIAKDEELRKNCKMMHKSAAVKSKQPSAATSEEHSSNVQIVNRNAAPNTRKSQNQQGAGNRRPSRRNRGRKMRPVKVEAGQEKPSADAGRGGRRRGGYGGGQGGRRKQRPSGRVQKSPKARGGRRRRTTKAPPLNDDDDE